MIDKRLKDCLNEAKLNDYEVEKLNSLMLLGVVVKSWSSYTNDCIQNEMILSSFLDAFKIQIHGSKHFEDEYKEFLEHTDDTFTLEEYLDGYKLEGLKNNKIYFYGFNGTDSYTAVEVEKIDTQSIINSINELLEYTGGTVTHSSGVRSRYEVEVDIFI